MFTILNKTTGLIILCGSQYAKGNNTIDALNLSKTLVKIRLEPGLTSVDEDQYSCINKNYIDSLIEAQAIEVSGSFSSDSSPVKRPAGRPKKVVKEVSEKSEAVESEIKIVS